MAIIDSNISLEQTVLGHALNDRACYQLFTAEINEDHFVTPNHRVLAYCLSKMSEIGIKIPDEDSFQLVVSSYEGDKDYGGAEYIRKLKAAFIDPTDNYQYLLDRLKLQSIKAKIGSDGVKSLLKISNDPATSFEDIRKLVNELNTEIECASSIGYNFKDTAQIGTEYLNEIRYRANRPFNTTGFPTLDERLTEGFLPKKITVMAGFTGMAKSTVAVNMAHRISVTGIGTAIFSMESTTVSLYDKVISTLTQIPLIRLKKEADKLTGDEHKRIAGAVGDLTTLPILINDQPTINIQGILYQLQSAYRRGYDPRVIFIDLFGKVDDVDTSDGSNLAQKIQRECKMMRVLAKNLDVHFVLIVQIGRQGYGKGKLGNIKRPTLIDIKNSNAFAEECDIALLLHRNSYYRPELTEDILEIDVAKQRDGEANNRVYFEFFGETSTIIETDKRPLDAPRNA